MFRRWDSANQSRVDRENAAFTRRAESATDAAMVRDIVTPRGRRLIRAVPIGEPVNDLDTCGLAWAPIDELVGLLLLPFVILAGLTGGLLPRFVGRGYYKVVICRVGRFGFQHVEYRSERLSEQEATQRIAALAPKLKAGYTPPQRSRVERKRTR